MAKLPQYITDQPYESLDNWRGYFDRRETTMLPGNALIAPSKNCFIPDSDVVVPRKGSKIYFQDETPEQTGVIGGYKKYKNLGGVEMDVRAYRSDSARGDVVEVLFNNKYVPITEPVNPYGSGTGDRIYFDVFFDSNLDFSKTKNLPRLCWVNGKEDNNRKGEVYSWTGGIAVIDSVTGTTISIADRNFRALGFTDNASEVIKVVVNGQNYTVSAGLDTNTITIGDTTGISPGDIVTSQVEMDKLDRPMQMLRENKGYMFYGHENYQNWYMSNAFGRPATAKILESHASLDDMIVVNPEKYTGKGLNNYRIQIDSIDPATDAILNIDQKFYGTGTPIQFDTSGYNITNSKNKYVLKCVSDYILTGSSGTYSGTFKNGEIVVGQTSGATGILVNNTGETFPVNLVSGIKLLYGSFIKGEQVKGQESGATINIYTFQIGSSVSLFKNDELVIIYRPAPFDISQISLNGSSYPFQQITIDGLVFDPQNYSYLHLNYGDYLELNIETKEADPGSPDEYVWQMNTGALSSPEDIDEGVDTEINNGLEVQFGNEQGHEVGDYWIIQVVQAIDRPWATFYYSIDLSTQEAIRRPGEGYIYKLPANFWTMETLEDSIFVNCSNGEWGYTTSTLSENLKSENINFTPLKQAGANKVLHQYMTGHSRNDMVFINENKQLDSLGRILDMDNLQMTDISNEVKNGFLNASFVKGSINYQDEKIWITSPDETIMFVYDEKNKYWHPPQYIPENGILTTIGNDLYSHSYVQTLTRMLNDPTAVGDDDTEYEVLIKTSNYDYGSRWKKKTSNEAYFEGYIEGNPHMELQIYKDVDGCGGIKSTPILPIFCKDMSSNDAVFGGGEFGDHDFGSDNTRGKGTYARFIYDKLGVMDYYFASLGFYARNKTHNYKILSIGLNTVESKSNNKEYKSPESDVDKLLPL